MNDKIRVNALETECAQLRKEVVDQATMLRAIRDALSILVHNVPTSSQPTTATLLVNTPTHSPATPIAHTCESALKPAMPNDFNGARDKGRAFLNSCELYMSLAPCQFANDQMRISWTLTFMKADRASIFSDRVLRYEERNGPMFANWAAFRSEFVQTFCPRNEAQNALTRLETADYHQGQRSVDDYTDEFRDLIELAGYTDGLVIVMKYRRGLTPEIQNQIATMTIGRPQDNMPPEWYTAASLCDENRRTNAAFVGAGSTPRTLAVCAPVPAFRTPQIAPPALPRCYRCGDTEHVQSDCPQQHDARFMTESEQQEFIQHFLATMDVRTANLAHHADQAETKVTANKEQDVALHSNTPPPRSANRFAVLEEETFTGNTSPPCETVCKDTPTSKPPSRVRIPKWERQLPKRYVVAATPGPRSLNLKVELQTTDTGDVLATNALLDCGATGLFIDSEYVRKNRLTVRTLACPIPVYNVDGTANEAGSIRGVVDLVLRYNGHTERAQFAVTGLGKQDLILGYTWLREHNPEVDWQTNKVKMSRCPAKCRTCVEEEKAEQREKRAEARRIHACRAGPMPSVDDDLCDVPDLSPDPDDDDDDAPTDADDSPIEEGDRIFMVNFGNSKEEIRATQNVSQRLAEAFHKNSETKSFRDAAPDHLHDFEDVFSKTAFDVLPDRKPWDHAIELIPDAENKSCKVYPLSVAEQEQLDKFLEENLASGRIRPSKSPMASPFFFVKKKDGALRPVQDYRVLNTMTVKNKYPLPLITDLINQLRGAKYFTKFDVRWGYNNVRIREGDEWKAAFRTNRGLFEPLVMFFGLTNSPATFQTMMNDIFQDLIMEGVVCVYLDDILIFTRTLEEHRRVTRIVMERLRKHKLFLRLDKCEFERTLTCLSPV